LSRLHRCPLLGTEPPIVCPKLAEGWGENTTGGCGGDTVTVTTAADLISYMQDPNPYIIQIEGTIDLSTQGGTMYDIVSNKTLVGIGPSPTITGGGLDIDDAADNVIIKNLYLENSPDDLINIMEGSTNIWIHKCTFSNAFDGMIDIKRESDFITVSWCKFNDPHEKTMLLGHDDAHTPDIGHLRVSYHHNWFDGTFSRHPRVRYSALCHVYNNLYSQNSGHGIASTMNAEVLVEGNYFDQCSNPTLINLDSPEDGDLVERDNIFNNCPDSPQTAGSVPEPTYSYDLDNAADVPSLVQTYAGAGTPEPPM